MSLITVVQLQMKLVHVNFSPESGPWNKFPEAHLNWSSHKYIVCFWALLPDPVDFLGWAHLHFPSNQNSWFEAKRSGKWILLRF